jgi:GT2 family glycosyltransferase
MAQAPSVAVVVPVHNDVRRTARFLDGFAAVDYPRYTLVVVDDGSTDGTARVLAECYPHAVRLRGTGGLWWAGATNRGVRYALRHGHDYVLTINNDARVSPDFLGRLVAAAETHPRSLVGCRIDFLSDPGKAWAVGSSMRWAEGEVFYLGHQGEARVAGPGGGSLVPVEALTGCGTLVPAACYREVGLYDAWNFPQYHADAEFVLRAGRRGYRAFVETRAVVYNDVPNSAAVQVQGRGWLEWLFSRRSAAYWRPVLAAHARYCPHRLRLRSLAQFYGWWFWRNDVRVRRLGWLIRPLAAGARRVAAAV